jgi:hypothetical protein
MRIRLRIASLKGTERCDMSILKDFRFTVDVQGGPERVVDTTADVGLALPVAESGCLIAQALRIPVEVELNVRVAAPAAA